MVLSTVDGRLATTTLVEIIAFDCTGLISNLASSSIYPYLWTLAVLFWFLAYGYKIGKRLENVPAPCLVQQHVCAWHTIHGEAIYTE